MKLHGLFGMAFLAFVTGCPLQAQRVLGTFAGADAYFAGQGNPAVNASLGRITSVALDPAGRPVFADAYYHLVLRVETDGTITIVAGNNIQGLSSNMNAPSKLGESGGGFSGDGGPPTQASLNRPQGVAFDSAGNLYIADAGNNRIRMVDAQYQTITTFAGTGQSGFVDGVSPLSAQLSYPIAVAVDPAGDLFINDAGNHCIRKIAPKGNISTIAGSGTQQTITSVEGIAADQAGNLYLADLGANQIREITTAGQLVTIAGTGTQTYSGDGGSPLSAGLNHPAGVAVDASNNIYISDTGNQRIRLIANHKIVTLAGTGGRGFYFDGGPATGATFWNPFGLAVSVSGTVFIADRDNFRIREIAANHNLITVAGNGQLLASTMGAQRMAVPLFDPFSVSLDAQGNVSIADSDNNVIREVVPSGVTNIVAGNGAAEWDGDNQPAIQAGLSGPFSVLPDNTGHLLISDTGNDRVRSFSIGGSIETIAGDGTSGPGPSKANSLQTGLEPVAVAVDGNNDLFLADFINNRLQIYEPDGTYYGAITGLEGVDGVTLDTLGNVYYTTFYGRRVYRLNTDLSTTILAGGGTLSGQAVEGMPGTSAQLSGPAGIVVDSNQNVYFSDAPNHIVYEIGPDQIMHVVAGNGTEGYSGDGGLATSGTLGFPWGLALDQSTNTLLIADVLNNRIRTAAPVLATFLTSATSLNLTAQSNGALTAPVGLNLTPSVPGLLYSVTTSGPLQITPAVGTMPATLQVQGDPTGLSAGTHSGTITITASGANPPTSTVAVNFTVQDQAKPQLLVNTQVLNLSLVAGAQPVSNVVTVSNTGGGVLNYTATVQGRSSWISIANASGSSTPVSSGSVPIACDPSKVSSPNGGTFSDAIVIDAGAAGKATIPVNLAVNPSQARPQLSQAALSFTLVEGGGNPLPQTVAIVNVGEGPMNWTVNKSNLSFSQDWLTITSLTSGTVPQPFTSTSPLTIAVDASAAANKTALAAGTYYGRVELHVNNSPTQTVTVVLNVLKAGTTLVPNVFPLGMVFTGPPGINPSSQTISIANVEANPITFTATPQSADGGNWIFVTPKTGTLSPGQPLQLVVQPNFMNLNTAHGAYSGKITLQFGNTSQDVPITALLTGGASSTAAGSLGRRVKEGSHGSGCDGDLNLIYTGGPVPLQTATGGSATLEVAVLDSCNNPIVNGPNTSVVATFTSPAETTLKLTNTDPSKGKWAHDWTPKTPAPASMDVTIYATTVLSNNTIANGETKPSVPVSVQTATASPIVNNGKILNGASLQADAPIAPGSYITLLGSNLAAKAAYAQSGGNLPTTLGGTQVLLNNVPVPLTYVSPNQINALIPYSAPVNGTFGISVSSGNALGAADSITVAPAAPAIFTVTEDGNGQGVIYDVNGNVVDSTHPASAGQVVSIYCTGLGNIQGSINDGEPATHAFPTVASVTALIGGLPAQVNFSGLAIGSVGLYRVDVVLPAAVASGSAVPVSISAANQTSKAVTMAVQ